jgi:NAD(P)H-nitrite reductase large subunit
MVGRREEYQGGFFMNSVEICNLPSISVGLTDPAADNGYESLVFQDRRRKIYKKLVLKENRLVGAILIGEIDRAGIFTGLIREGLDVGGIRGNLMRDDFGLISLPKEYRKHLVSGEGIEV